MISRRSAICLTGIGLSATASIGRASAADYPTRPVKWVVGYPPGGATDIIARLIGQRLSERLGQQFVIENKPGAGNNIGTESVVNAEPDGYTVLLVNPANYINASLYANLKFNFVRDIAPVASFNRVPNVMTVNKDVPAKNGRRVHRLCEGQSRQGEHGLVGQRHLGASVRRNVHGDDGRQDAARALSRRGARDHRSARRPGPGDLRQHALDHPAHPRRRACARWPSPARRALAAAAGRADASPRPCPATRRARCSAWARRRTRRRRSSPSSTPRSTRSSPSPTIKAPGRTRRRTADRHAGRVRRHDRRRNREVEEGDRGSQGRESAVIQITEHWPRRGVLWQRRRGFRVT